MVNRGQAGRDPARNFATYLKRDGFLPTDHFVERLLQRALSQGVRFDPNTFRREFYQGQHFRQTRPGHNTRIAMVRNVSILYRVGGENGNRIVLVGATPPMTPSLPPIQRESMFEFEAELVPDWLEAAYMEMERTKNVRQSNAQRQAKGQRRSQMISSEV